MVSKTFLKNTGLNSFFKSRRRSRRKSVRKSRKRKAKRLVRKSRKRKAKRSVRKSRKRKSRNTRLTLSSKSIFNLRDILKPSTSRKKLF